VGAHEEIGQDIGLGSAQLLVLEEGFPGEEGCFAWDFRHFQPHPSDVDFEFGVGLMSRSCDRASVFMGAADHRDQVGSCVTTSRGTLESRRITSFRHGAAPLVRRCAI